MTPLRLRLWVVTLLLLPLAGCLDQPASELAPEIVQGDGQAYVVVATLDTGANPIHPTWRRDITAHPSTFIDGYPEDATALDLQLSDDYSADLNASVPWIDMLPMTYPVYVPGTNIIGVWTGADDQRPFFDARAIQNGSTGSSSHGAQASSQIAGTGYSLAPDAHIVIMDRTSDQGSEVYWTNAQGLRWAADQPWIDIIHTNIQNPLPFAGAKDIQAPLFPGYPDAVEYAVSKGKLVVSAGGNFWAEPTETSPHAGPTGVLVAGANDNCGTSDFSNPDPHVVMDGYSTVSAAPDSDEDGSFGGTSSASPRITGYAARLLMDLRTHFNITTGMVETDLIRLAEGTWPDAGPLSDGALTAAEMHEVIRKTANPNPHPSEFDGDQGMLCVPLPDNAPFAFYPKMGYGEVSEHTLPMAFAVAIGESAMPDRPVEDAFYGFSETVRTTAWS